MRSRRFLLLLASANIRQGVRGLASAIRFPSWRRAIFEWSFRWLYGYMITDGFVSYAVRFLLILSVPQKLFQALMLHLLFPYSPESLSYSTVSVVILTVFLIMLTWLFPIYDDDDYY